MKKEDVEKYKEKTKKEIILPSGLNVTIRELSPFHLMQVEDSIKNATKGVVFETKLIEGLFSLFLISPEIPTEMRVEDFSKVDYEFLFDELIKCITYPENKEELVKS